MYSQRSQFLKSHSIRKPTGTPSGLSREHAQRAGDRVSPISSAEREPSAAAGKRVRIRLAPLVNVEADDSCEDARQGGTSEQSEAEDAEDHASSSTSSAFGSNAVSQSASEPGTELGARPLDEPGELEADSLQGDARVHEAEFDAFVDDRGDAANAGGDSEVSVCASLGSRDTVETNEYRQRERELAANAAQEKLSQNFRRRVHQNQGHAARGRGAARARRARADGRGAQANRGETGRGASKQTTPQRDLEGQEAKARDANEHQSGFRPHDYSMLVVGPRPSARPDRRTRQFLPGTLGQEHSGARSKPGRAGTVEANNSAAVCRGG